MKGAIYLTDLSSFPVALFYILFAFGGLMHLFFFLKLFKFIMGTDSSEVMTKNILK